MQKNFFIAVGVLASIIVIGLYVGLVVLKPAPGPVESPVIPEVSAGLSSVEYASQVEPLLQEIASADEPSLAIAEATVVLGGLTVSREVSSDHLALFLALDSWQRYPDDEDQARVIRMKLSEFSEHQDWARELVTTILDRHL